MNDNDNKVVKSREFFDGNSYEECCDDFAQQWDWDDSHVLNSEAESDLFRTDRTLLKIVEVDDDGEEKEVPKWVYDYYDKASDAAMG